MNPNPFSALNHFTVPCGIHVLLHCSSPAGPSHRLSSGPAVPGGRRDRTPQPPSPVARAGGHPAGNHSRLHAAGSPWAAVMRSSRASRSSLTRASAAWQATAAAPLGARAKADRTVPSSRCASAMRRSISGRGTTADVMVVSAGLRPVRLSELWPHGRAYPRVTVPIPGSTLRRRVRRSAGVSRYPDGGGGRGRHSTPGTPPTEEHMTSNTDNHFVAQAVHDRSEEHTSELQSRQYLVCRLLLEKKKKKH